MPEVTIDATVPDAHAARVFERLRDFPAYPRFTDAVREVRVAPAGPDTVDAHWSVNFRNGVLCWSERDTFDPAEGTITFTQTAGDFDRFAGSWRIEQRDDAVVVRFACEFDLGMPSLAPMIDPIACETLVDNIQIIMRGLLGERVTFADVVTRSEATT